MQTQTNPFIQVVMNNADEELILKRWQWKFQIEAIYDWSKPPKEEVFDQVRIFCREHQFQFTVREFMKGIVEDREIITKLPAFHVLSGDDEYERTFYPEDSPTMIMLDVIREREATRPSMLAQLKRVFTFKLPTLKRSRLRRMASSDA
jgi:hypothetical protein